MSEIVNLGETSKSSANRELINFINANKSVTLTFRSRRDGQIHKITYECIEDEIKVDADGSKWKRIYD